MGKSLGDYNIEQSSSADIRNIKWTQKNKKDTEKSKKKVGKKHQKSSASNIIYAQKPKVKAIAEKVFKVEEVIDAKSKKKVGKKHQKSSASNSKIKQGFKRPGR